MNSKKNEGINIREIAKMAGVSPTTVSFVINEKKGVSDETRKRVKKIIDEVGYMRNRIAAHSSPRANVCIVKYSGGTKNYEYEEKLIANLNNICNRLGLYTYMVMCNASNFASMLDHILSEHYDGVLLLGTYLKQEQIDVIRCHKIVSKPLMVIDNIMLNTNISSVAASDAENSEIAVRYLFEKGFRNIGYICEKNDTSNMYLRKIGYINAMRECGVKSDTIIEISNSDISDVYEEMHLWCTHHKTIPQAFLAENAAIALGALRAFQEFGLNIPQDISIVSCEDMAMGGFLSPTLTAVSNSYDDICNIAAHILFEDITMPNPNWTAVHIQLRGKLIERESVKNCTAEE